MKLLKNVSASVLQRLLNRSRNNNRSFNELLQYYAMERFLYRLSQSDHAQDFILKGALMLRAWNSPEFRPTMDIDMLGKTANEDKNITSLIRNILAMDVVPDGLAFDSESIQTERITGTTNYEGIRVRFQGTLATARINMQIDIGFGDIVYPEPIIAEFPCMLDFPALKLLCYSRESAIAEKFEAMIKLGKLNSRMKDFYDIWLLSRQFQFELSSLGEAVRQTFEQRGTKLNEPTEAFSKEFIFLQQPSWTAFHKRLNQDHIPESFHEIVSEVESFLEPVIKGVTNNITWKPSGPWS